MESVALEGYLPPESLRRSLQARGSDLAMLPAVAKEAMDVAQHPDCTADQFASVVEKDVKLATDMLSFANSAVFAATSPVIHLRQAVVRLGFRKCRNLILGSSAASLMQSLPLQEEWVREVLWQHSYVTATTCSHLNQTFNLGFCGEEFTAGLLHDFGRLLLALAAPDSFPQADPLDFVEGPDLLERESDILGTDHCCFGAWFATENGLPEQLVYAIRYHHDPEIEQPHQKLACLVAAADHIASYLQHGSRASDYDPEDNKGAQVLSELTDDRFACFPEVAATLVQEVMTDLGSSRTGVGA